MKAVAAGLGEDGYEALYLHAWPVSPELGAKLRRLLGIGYVRIRPKAASTDRAVLELRAAKPPLQFRRSRAWPEPTNFGRDFHYSLDQPEECDLRTGISKLDYAP
jgi:hypothetical protein